MKKDNRYARALSKIEPDRNFVEDTLKKLQNEKAPSVAPRRSFTKYALPLAAALTVVAIAVGVLPRLTGSKTITTNATDATGTPGATLVATVTTALPSGTPTATPLATMTPMPVSTAMPTLPPGDSAKQSRSEAVADTEEAPGEVLDGYMYADAFVINGYAYESGMNGIQWNTEEYSFIAESGFRSARLSPLSTFAADVDTAGYTTLRRKLLSEERLSPSSVRIEEMLNYFHYDGLAPTDGAPMAISAYLDACPWNEDAALLFVGIGAQQIDTSDLPRSNLVFLIDTSGSMDGSDRLDLAKRAFHLLIDTLSPGDTISVVTYSGSFRVLLNGVDAANKSEILDVIDSLEARGSTNGGDAMVTAYKIAEEHFIEGGNNRVIMMTDGDLNVGITSQSDLVSLVESKKESGVFLSVLGFGMGNYKDNKLEALADHGNGVYSYIDGITEARRTLVTEMGANFYTVAKDVKIQVEFNPAYVSSYRLIGYENREMASEDFADDSKDGGEMGSGHTVVALYELIPAEGASIAGVTGKSKEETQDSLRYQSTQNSGIDEVALISIRYKQPDGDESSLMSVSVKPDDVAEGLQARNLKKAAAIAEFGMALRQSEYIGSGSYDSAYQLASSLSNPTQEETELMYLMVRAKDLCE